MIGFGRGAVTALLVSSCFLLLAVAARADESYAVGPAPVLKVTLTSGRLLVQTGDSPQVSIATSGSLDVEHLDANAPGARVPAQIPVPAQSIDGPHGAVVVAKETFVLPALASGRHDALVIRGAGDTTITVPRGTAFILAHVRTGHLTLLNYDGVFVTHVRNGDLALQHVGGTGFAQSLFGSITATNSNFTRLRARTVLGDMLFRGCSSRQIEATSTYGSVVYDNGQFQPGLARFESEHGNVAIGVQNDAGGVQIGAHSGSGRIVSNFADGTPVSGSASDTQASVRGGGPVVTTSTQDGSVYLYNGSMSAHPAVQQSLQASGATSAAMRPVVGAQRAPAPVNYPGSRNYPGSSAAAAKSMQPVRVQPRPRYPAPQPQPTRKHHPPSYKY